MIHLSVVLPAYNEAAELPAGVAAIDRAVADRFGPVEIIVVDDHSTDGSYTPWPTDVPDAELVVTRLHRHCGKGAAVRAGLAQARGKIVAFTDADSPIAAHSLVACIEAVAFGGYDLAAADRFGPGALRQGGSDGLRSVGSKVFRRCVQTLQLGLLRDPAGCLKVFSADIAGEIVKHARIDGYAFDVEAMVIARRAGARIYEVPVTWTDKRAKLSIWRFSHRAACVVGELLRIRASLSLDLGRSALTATRTRSTDH